MTNAEKIRSMTDEELLAFLNDWTWETASELFGKKFCAKCEPVVVKPDGYYRALTFSKCEFDDYTCPYDDGDCVRWWLNADCEETSNNSSNTLTN